ncbi:MAG: sulfite exporter TauE/SafE family protein [Chitinophagales bacterium]
MNALLIAAFITGLFGSLHCAGMCGPLALTWNMQHRDKVVIHAFAYNLARISAYFLVGLFFGSIGLSFSFAGLQQIASIVMGVGILLFVISGTRWKIFGSRKGFLERITVPLRKKMMDAFQAEGTFAVMTLGFFNGLLPCGLVYLALAGAVAGGSILHGGIYMLFFGLGTLPMMFSLSAFGNFIGMKGRFRIRKYLPAFSILVAVLLILRGLNLGIPYVSPHFDQQAGNGMSDHCH